MASSSESRSDSVCPFRQMATGLERVYEVGAQGARVLSARLGFGSAAAVVVAPANGGAAGGAGVGIAGVANRQALLGNFER